MKKFSKINFNRALVITFFAILIFLGVGYISTKVINVKTDDKYATGDFFTTTLLSNSNSIVAGDTLNLSLKLSNINVYGGDKGIGALSLVLNYDKSVFTNLEMTSSVASITKNDSTGEIVLLVNNADVLKGDTVVLNLTFTSNPNATKQSTAVSVTNVLGSSTETIKSNDTSVNIQVEDGGAPVISFLYDDNTTYKKKQSVTVKVTDSDLDSDSLFYYWSQNSPFPDDDAFVNPFSNNDPITLNNESGKWYLWVLAEDERGNKSISRSDAVYLDNEAPTCYVQRTGSRLVVTANDGYSGLADDAYLWSGSNWANRNYKDIEESGTYIVNVKDRAENIGSCSYKVEDQEVVLPMLAVSVPSSVAVKSLNIKIDVTKGSNELSDSNQYSYFLDTKLQPEQVGNLESYVAGENFTIGEELNGIYYLYVKAVMDSSNNESEVNGDIVEIEGSNYHRFGPYIFDNKAPTCTVSSSNSNWTNKEITLTISGKDGEDAFVGTYSFDNESFSNTNRQTINENKTYMGYVKDNAGNVGSCSIEVNNIDTKAPEIVIEKNGLDTYVKEVSTKVTVSDDLSDVLDSSLKYQWTKSLEQPAESTFTEPFENGHEVTKNIGSGEWYLWILASDKASNKKIVHSNIFYFDNEVPGAPLISGNVQSGIESSSNVVLTISGSSALSQIKKYQYSFNGGETWEDYNSEQGLTISEEGTTKVIARAVSNVGIEGVSSKEYVVNIKHKPMVLTISQNTHSVTNQDVVVTIKSSTKLSEVAGWNLIEDNYAITKTYHENTSDEGEVVEITDIYGNTERQTIKITNIDKVLEEVKVTYTKEEDGVVAVVSCSEQLQSVSGWTLGKDNKSMSKKYLKNTTDTVKVTDLAGNNKDVSIEITGIVTEKYKVIVNYEEQASNRVKVTITSNKILKATGDWTISDDGYSMYKYYSTNIDEQLEVENVDNEKQTVKLKYDLVIYDWNLKVTYSKETLTNENVIVSIISDTELNAVDGWQLSGDDLSLTKVYNENTTESVEVKTFEGDKRTVNIEVKNIDKVKPSLLNYQNHGVYSSLKLKFSEDVKMVTVIKDGKDLNYKIGDEKEYTEEGSYIITIVDKAENVSIYDIVIKSNKTIVDVPDTASTFNKILLIFGIIEIVVGILMFIRFGIKTKVNLMLLLILTISLRAGISRAVTSTALDLCGYSIKSGYLYNVEASTNYSQMKSNLDDGNITIKRENTEIGLSDIVKNGDNITYQNNNYTLIISGDVNADGKVDINDKDSLARYLTSNQTYNTVNQLSANYNNSANVDISDLYLVNKRVVKGYTIKVKGIKATATSKVIVGSSGTVSAKVYPVNAYNKGLSYSIITGSNVVSIPNSSAGSFKGLRAGSAVISVSSSDGRSTSVSVSVSNSYKLHVINVESGGDAMILESNGHYGMIDTGIAAAYSKIKKQLDDLNVQTLDFMIITHNHADHIGSALSVINNYNVANLYIKEYSANDIVTSDDDETETLANRTARYQNVVDAAKRRGTNIKYVSTSTSNNKLSLDAFDIRLFNLDDHLKNCSGKTSENVNSITELLTITVGSKTIKTYLESDLTNSTCKNSSGQNFKEMVYNQVLSASNGIDLYKVAHHGDYNGTSSAELSALKPKMAFATSSYATINGKTQSNKLSTINALKSYFGSSFNTDFRLASQSVLTIDYTSGTVVMSGGSTWTS